jgi:chemotaxis protein histidine kinase CheA
MHSTTSIYKSRSVLPIRQKWMLCCASSVLLTLVSLHPVSLQAQDVQGIELDPIQWMKPQLPSQQGEQSQPITQRAPVPLSEKSLQIISNIIKNLSPTGRELMLNKTYTPEERQQILTYMESQTPKTQAPQQESKPQLTLEQRRQLMLVQQSEMTPPAREEIKKTEMLTTEQQKKIEQVQTEKAKEQIKQTEKLTPEQQKQLLLTQQLEQQKKIEQVQTEQTKEKIKQVEKPTTEQQKQLVVIQQSEPQKQQEKIQPQQLKEVIKQVEQPALEQPKQILQTTQTSLPATTPPDSLVQQKYQKLLEAGVFSSSDGKTQFSDATMTRAQFAMIANKLKDLTGNTGTTFSDIPGSLWSGLTGQQTIGTIEGAGKPSLTVVSDDKKTSVDFMQLLAAYSKEKVSQEELDKLITKLGSMNPAVKPAASLFNGEVPVLGAIRPVEQIVTPPGTAAVATGMTGITSGGLIAMQAALAAAQAAAIAASSSANNIDQETAVIAGANYAMVTPRANFPTNLNATFNGRMSGTLSDSSAVGANLTMNVNFANIGNGTPIGGNVQFDNNKGNASFNSVAYIGGYVGGGMNGTYNGEAMNGFIRNGQFFGPAANAVKGSWDMTTNSVSGGGSFAATR